MSQAGLRASDMRSSDAERAEIMAKVRDGAMTMDEALARIADLELRLASDSPEHEHDSSVSSPQTDGRSTSPTHSITSVSSNSSIQSHRKSSRTNSSSSMRQRTRTRLGSMFSIRRKGSNNSGKPSPSKRSSKASSIGADSSVPDSPANGEPRHPSTPASPFMQKEGKEQGEQAGKTPETQKRPLQNAVSASALSAPTNPFASDIGSHKASQHNNQAKEQPQQSSQSESQPEAHRSPQQNSQAAGNKPAKDTAICLARVVETPSLSVYDAEALHVNKGDVVEVLDMESTSSWVCRFQGKVGLVKFIYLEEELTDSNGQGDAS